MYVDRGKISQVLRNFLSNALKFTPEGGHVSVGCSAVVLAGVEEEKPQLDEERMYDRDASRATPLMMGQRSRRTSVVYISVTDSGAGLSEEQQQKLFRQAVQFRANELQAGGGSGFGLLIAKGIAELHGGSVGVWSAGEGKGSTFHLVLPVHVNNIQ